MTFIYPGANMQDLESIVKTTNRSGVTVNDPNPQTRRIKSYKSLRRMLGKRPRLLPVDHPRSRSCTASHWLQLEMEKCSLPNSRCSPTAEALRLDGRPINVLAHARYRCPLISRRAAQSWSHDGPSVCSLASEAIPPNERAAHSINLLILICVWTLPACDSPPHRAPIIIEKCPKARQEPGLLVITGMGKCGAAHRNLEDLCVHG